MNDKIESGIQEIVKDALDSSLHSIRFNLGQVFGKLLFSIKVELEAEGGVGDIDELIRIVMDTSKYDGPEGEEYPVWNVRDKKAVEILKRMKKVLQKHDIKSFNP